MVGGFGAFLKISWAVLALFSSLFTAVIYGRWYFKF